MTKQISGIEGVLGSLTSTPKQPKPVVKPIPERKPIEKPAAPASLPKPQTPSTPKLPATIQPTRTRIGRPRGIKAGQTPPKRKTTVLLNAEVMDEYDRWSWEVHCNIGALFERALVEYLRRNRSSAKPS
jgi:hypothetical protein